MQDVMTLQKVGRYKFNKKLMLKNRITGHTLAEDVVSPMTGEVIAEAGAVVDRELADAIQNAAVPYVWIAREESDRNIKVLSNMMVDLKAVCGIDPEEVGVTDWYTIRYLLNSWKRQPEISMS